MMQARLAGRQASDDKTDSLKSSVHASNPQLEVLARRSTASTRESLPFAKRPHCRQKASQLSDSQCHFRTAITPSHAEPPAASRRSIKMADQSASHSGSCRADKRPKSCLRTEIAPLNSSGHRFPNRVYHWPVLERLSILRGLGNPERWQSCVRIAVADRPGGCDILGR